MDGETAIQYFYPLQIPQRISRPLDLPNSTVLDCCADFKIKVLAGIDANIDQDDFTSFLNICPTTSSAAVYKLYKNVNGAYELQDELVNNDYGIYYAYGFEQVGLKKYIGYRIEWKLVLSLFGEGVYKVELSVTDALLGNFTAISEEYQLCKYSQHNANGTIRLNWFQSGIIGDKNEQRNIFDYLDLNWENQIRIPGYFGYASAEMLNEWVRYNNGLDEWTLTEQTPKYQLQTKQLPWNIREIIRTNIMFADRITITDYNSNNETLYQDFEIKFNSGFDPKYFIGVSKLAHVNLVAEQRFNNLKKFR